jgi:hypothetical protein
MLSGSGIGEKVVDAWPALSSPVRSTLLADARV